ncbi:MAG: dynamin family protein [Terracidiphilus sp.]
MNLKQYEQEKFAIAAILRSAQATDTKDQTLRAECQELLTRLAEDRFNLLVVGRFNRGKSTLMNALLGGDHLPTGMVPLTSVLTTVRYGSRRRLELSFHSTGMRREVPMTQLAEYGTQQGNPGNIRNIALASIELPVEILRRGLFFVDSPGLGSSMIENTQATERFLPQADAFILVTSYESSLSEEEDRILQRIQLTNRKLFMVVNKQDTVSAKEREEVLSFVAERLDRFAFAEIPRIFSVSARMGLQAKLSGDEKMREESGLASFETELLRFLAEERSRLFLSNFYERAADLLARGASPQGNEKQGKILRNLAEKLNHLREKSLGAKTAAVEAAPARQDSENLAAALEIDKRAGCGICAAILETVFRFLSRYQYELTIDAEIRRRHAADGGFCPLHTWQYENLSSPYGVCTAYPELVHRMARELERIAAENQGCPPDELQQLRAGPASCRVCATRVEAERSAVARAAESVRKAAVKAEERMPACCLAHLSMVAAALGPGPAARSLLQTHAQLLERTAEDLERYALRHDALRRHLSSEEERRAAQLTLLLLAGHRSVQAPWNIELIV